MKRTALILLVCIGACGSPSEKEAWQGTWNAKWETDRNAPGYESIPAAYSFEMNGTFSFEGDNVTIAAYGFPKCIFQSDTSIHTQSWVRKGDTLELQNQPGEIGLVYQILEQSSDKIRLQLVDDIFITLTK
jgi:hypothetical protein